MLKTFHHFLNFNLKSNRKFLRFKGTKNEFGNGSIITAKI